MPKQSKRTKGPGAVGPAIAAATDRLIGFELQFGPFAVAQLRLLAELQDLIGAPFGPTGSLPTLKLFITDTLGDPYALQARFSSMVAPIGQSRKDANAIKRKKPITVVIGNPPYKEKARGRGGWIEQGSDANRQQSAPMDRWAPPVVWGVSAHAKHLKNLYVYFWRWATLKVFGSGWYAATGEPDTDRSGIVCFITVAGFLNGPGFEKIRDDLRRDCANIWVIDCSPEGHQPGIATRIFQGVQQPVCIVLAVRTPGKDRTTPARVRFVALPRGRREQKFAALDATSLRSPEWFNGPAGWRDPFSPAQQAAWMNFTPIEELFVYNGSGVMPGRTWVIAPDRESLEIRWKTLTRENDPARKELLFHAHLRRGKPGDKHVGKSVQRSLAGHPSNIGTVANDVGQMTPAMRYAPRLARGQGLTIPANGAIPGPPEPLPDSMDYDPTTHRLRLSKGFIDNVPQAVWNYEVSGKNVLRQWFSYRKLDRSRPIIGDRRLPSPLDQIQPEHWHYEYTSDLIDLLHVLGRLVALEPRQAQLLDEIIAGPLIDNITLTAAGALASSPTRPKRARNASRTNSAQGDFLTDP